MSGTTSQPFTVDDVLGSDVLGDDATTDVNTGIADAAAAVDDADEPVDDVAADVTAAADDADASLDDIGDDGTDGADGASGAGGADGTPGLATADGASGAVGAAPQTVAALIAPVNNSGALGLALATLDGNVLDVRVIAANVEPGQVHPLHLHGFPDGTAERLPVAADDADGDGVGETPEGESAAFGPVLAGLTTTGEAQAGLEVSPDYPTANAAGQLVFSQRYVLDSAEADDAGILAQLQQRLEGRVIELHGATLPAGLGAGTGNEVDGTAGYSAQVPIAAGQLLALPAEVTTALGTLLADQPQALANGITALLDALAPYTLRFDGSGPLAPDAAATGGSAAASAAPDGTVVTLTAPAATPPADETSAAVATDATTTADTTSAGATTGATTTVDATATPADDGATYTALLLPTNNSGVLGAATITFDATAGTVAVDLDVAGLEPGEVHATHIHGFTNDRASLLPNLTVDADRDGFVEDAEGAPFIGPVLLALTEDGSLSDATLTANFPAADEQGRISLEQTYSFDLSNPIEAALFGELQDRLEGRALQVHGLTLPATEGDGTTGEVNGTAGYKPGLPVANGIILADDDQGGQVAAALGELIHASLDGEAPDLAALTAAFQVQPVVEPLIA